MRKHFRSAWPAFLPASMTLSTLMSSSPTCYRIFMPRMSALDTIPEPWWDVICNKRFWEVDMSKLPGWKGQGEDYIAYSKRFGELFRQKCKERGLKAFVRIKSNATFFHIVCCAYVQALNKEDNVRDRPTMHPRSAPPPNRFK